MSVYEKMTAIADAIREKTGNTDKLTLDDMAENISKVYDAGKEAENDEWWKNRLTDEIHGATVSNGLLSLASAFSRWSVKNFKPTRIIQVGQRHSTNRSMNSAFMYFGYPDGDDVEISLPKIFEKYGGGLNLLYAYDIRYLFQYSKVTDVGRLDWNTIGGSYARQAFDGCTKLKRAILANIGQPSSATGDGASLDFDRTFKDCSALEELFFENCILRRSIDLADCPQIKDSIISTVSSLDDAVSGYSVTFNLAAVNRAYETSDGANDGSTSEEWLTQVAEKPNWTINLV